MRAVHLSACGVSIGVACLQAVAAVPKIVALQPLAGGTYSEARGLSTNGEFVVGRSGSSSGQRAFRWSAATGMLDLGVLAGGSVSSALGTSADGSFVVGTSGSSLGPAGGDRVMRWSAQGGLEQLGVLPGGDLSWGRGISDDGSVVVGMSTTSGGNRAFRWTGGVMQQLSSTNISSSSAEAVSGNGQVVVGIERGDFQGVRLVSWTGGGISQPLGSLSGWSAETRPSDVNFDGSVIVGAAGDVSGGWRAFRWTSDSIMMNLGVLNGMTNSSADAVSADGQVVVGTSWNSAGVNAAFMWTPSLGLADLNVLLPSIGIDLSGWSLQHATGVSSDGSVITGWGRFNGQQRAFVVTNIPSPGGVCVVVASVGFLSRRRRRSL